MNLFLAMMSHETNTFSNVPTDRAQFEAHDLRYGGEIVEAYRGTGTCLGGMIDAAERLGATLVPSVAAAASPAGLVTKDIYAAREGAPARRPRARRAGSTACCSTCTARWCRRAWTTARAT